MFFQLLSHDGGVNRNVAQDEEEIVYVEGVVIGVLAQPMLHAWNAAGLSSTTARDWTQYLGSQWSRYIGIPVTQKEYWDMCTILHPDKPKRLCRLLYRDTFPITGAYLTELLEKRSSNTAAQK
jgi:hypothetical protein